MDDRLITQALQDTARKEIPEDMNIYPEIQNSLGRATRSAARSRTSWVVAAILAMLALSIVGYAAARLLQSQQLDPGLQGASEVDLVTELNIEQTIDGVTVRLDYAYADANRISLAYTSDGDVPLGTTYQFTSDRLTDDAGRQFQTMFGGGGGGGGGGGSADSNTPVFTSFSMSQQSSFDASVIEGSPDELHLRFEVSLMKFVAPTGDGSTTSEATEQSAPPSPQETIGPFVYEFSIPFISGQLVEPEQSASAAGITMRLDRLVVAPSLTRGSVCFEPPLPEAAYMAPIVSLTIDGEAVALDAEQIFFPAPEGSPEGCVDLQINQALYNRPGTWRLSIDSLVRSLGVGYSSGSNGTTANYSVDGTPDQLALVRAKLEPGLQAYGIELTESEGSLKFSFRLDSGISQHDLDMLIYDAVHDQTPGPWVFTFDVPSVQ